MPASALEGLYRRGLPARHLSRSIHFPYSSVAFCSYRSCEDPLISSTYDPLDYLFERLVPLACVSSSAVSFESIKSHINNSYYPLQPKTFINQHNLTHQPPPSPGHQAWTLGEGNFTMVERHKTTKSNLTCSGITT